VHKAIDLCTANGYRQQAGEAYLELGNSYANTGQDLEEKIRCYRQGLQWFVRAGNRRRQADVRKDLGDLYTTKGDNAHSLLELGKALALYRAIGYRELQGVYDLMGIVATILGDYRNGLRYGLLAVKTAEDLGDSTLQLCTIYNRVGITYEQLKQYQKALSYYEKSLSVARRYNDHASIQIVTGNIIFVMRRLNRLQEALTLLRQRSRQYPPGSLEEHMDEKVDFINTYTALKLYAKAQPYAEELIALAGKIGKNHNKQLLVYTSVIPLFLASKQYERARDYLVASELFCKAQQILGGTSMTHLWWFRLDSAQARYHSAMRHYQLHKKLEDSLYNQTKSRQLAELEVLHETERKEKDLLLKEQSIRVLTQERQLQDQQMAQDKLVRNAIIGGAALLLLLLGVIYNRYRIKQRSNEQLKAQQQQLQVQQQAINRQNVHLSALLSEKDALIEDKEGLLQEKDELLSGQARLLEEKERLLKEIHHRVKNNLQVVMSLLDSQAASLADKAALSAIRESQHRVQAMALIHQKLYQAEGVSCIPMKAYIEEVVAYLSESYQLEGHVRLDVQVDVPELDVVQAVPLGLIINEAITNAFKYAFPGGGPVRCASCWGGWPKTPASW
jgi:two-component sensor histidine kinase/tetratricopeptide (TPR) repeat protein